MPEGKISQIITAYTVSARIEDGAELWTPQTLPSPWKQGDMLTIELPSNERVSMIAEPDDGPNLFAYKLKNGSTWQIVLEALAPNSKGHHGLRVRFMEQHKYLQARDDAEGR